jgi:hypothetical protein
MPTGDIIMVLLFVIIMIILGWAVAWSFMRPRSLIERWAAHNGYWLVRSEYRAFRKGPFTWDSSRAQTVHYVEVLDEAGNRRTGWVRCGSSFLGLLSDQLDVRWEQ